ncbi:MAG: hypothetical protein Aureis2KO_16310 [Aureisphaera sp.]
MLTRLLYLLPFILLLACSSNDDSPTEMEQEMEEEEEMLQTYSFGMNVSADYLGDAETAKVFVSNIAGVVVFEAEIVNGEMYDFSFEAAENQQFDFTLYRLLSTAGVGLYRVTTFENFVFSDYTLDRKDVPESLEDVSLDYFNFGQPDPSESSLFYSQTSGSYSSDAGGTISVNGEMVRNGGSFYMAVRNDTESFPRHFWEESVSENISVSDDYNNLPFADDILSISYPTNESARAIVMGHKNYDTNSGANVLRDQISNSEVVSMNVFMKDNLFDFYEVVCSYSSGNRNYSYEELSEGLNFEISNPSFDFSVQDNGINSFSASTSGNYDTFGASYRFTDDVSFNVSYTIVGEANPNIGFTKSALFDAIFSDILLIGSESLESIGFGLSGNNSVSSYQEAIQDNLSVSINTDVLGHIEQSVSEVFQ